MSAENEKQRGENDNLTSVERYRKLNPKPTLYTNDNSYYEYTEKLKSFIDRLRTQYYDANAKGKAELLERLYFDPRTNEDIKKESNQRSKSQAVSEEVRERMIKNSKKEDHELWPLQFPEKVLMNEFKKNISKGGRELLYSDCNKIFNMIKQHYSELYPTHQLDKAKEYISELGKFCSKIPEWSWEAKNRYIIRGFLTREECRDELNEKEDGTFIICIRDEPSVGFMIAFVNSKHVTFIKVEHDDDTFSIIEDKYPSLSDCIVDYVFLNNIQVSPMGTHVNYRELFKAKRMIQEASQQSTNSANIWANFKIPESFPQPLEPSAAASQPPQLRLARHNTYFKHHNAPKGGHRKKRTLRKRRTHRRKQRTLRKHH